jgi:thiol-disulfide isomerase/thioredoxin
MAVKEAEHLLDFYGTECPHCIDMDPLMERLEKEEGIKVKKVEVWHNSKNAELWKKYDQGKCGGVPFFYNTKTKKFLCGSTDYATFKKWALGK